MNPITPMFPSICQNFAPDLPEEKLEVNTVCRGMCSSARNVMSNQKPNSCYEFEHTTQSVKKHAHRGDGVCDACLACRNKVGRIDWSRERQAEELRPLPQQTEAGTALVPGSGGKDSFYAAHAQFKRRHAPAYRHLGAAYLYPWGWENFQAWIHAGFDNYLCTPNATHRLLTRLATENLSHPFQALFWGRNSLLENGCEVRHPTGVLRRK